MNWQQLNEHFGEWENHCLEAYFNKVSIYFSLSYYYMFERYKQGGELTVEELVTILEKNGVQCSPDYAKRVLKMFRNVLQCLHTDNGYVRGLIRSFGLDYDVAEFFCFNKCITMTEEEFLNSYDYKRNLAWLANKENIIVAYFLQNANTLYYLRGMSTEQLCDDFVKSAKMTATYMYRQIHLSARKVANVDKVLKACLADIKWISDNYDSKTKKSSVDATMLISKYGLDYVFVDIMFLRENRYPC